MSIPAYLNLLQWGAYAAMIGVVLALAALLLAGIALVLVADIRRRLVIGAEVRPPDPPPALDFPAWVNPSEKRPAA